MQSKTAGSELYSPDATYNAVVAALCNPKPAPGQDLVDAIKAILGEVGDIWPASIAEDYL